MFFRACLRSIRTLQSPETIALLVKSAIVALIAFIFFLIGVGVLLANITFVGEGAAEWLLDAALTFGAGFISWLLLPTLLPAIAAFFQEQIANRIERQDYPEFIPPKHEAPWYVDLWEESKFVVLLIFLNILFLPFIFFPFIHFMLNSYLIGREFFETAAARHLGPKHARTFRRQHRMPVLLAGMATVGLALVPFVQLIAPFIGVALAVHLYHLLPKPAEILPPEDDVKN